MVERVRRRVIVEGRVQGVGFRVSCARAARDAGLAGVVRNLPDGRVEAVFEGTIAHVDSLVAWCRRGPSHAHVRNVRVSEEVPRGDAEFRIE
ncbi:MAG: acylphosphatase [Acidimicrobiia bacterium]